MAKEFVRWAGFFLFAYAAVTLFGKIEQQTKHHIERQA